MVQVYYRQMAGVSRPNWEQPISFWLDLIREKFEIFAFDQRNKPQQNMKCKQKIGIIFVLLTLLEARYSMPLATW